MFTDILKIRQIKLKLFAAILLALGSGASHAADPAKGGALYSMHCASCHGASGTSVMPGTPNFKQGGAMLRPDSFLLNIIKKGKNASPAYEGILSDRDILDVIAYMRTFN